MPEEIRCEFEEDAARWGMSFPLYCVMYGVFALTASAGAALLMYVGIWFSYGLGVF